jgi:hypothetical protein
VSASDTNGKANGASRPEEDEVSSPLKVRELAASCARFVHTKYGVPLDGTSDTLSLLDQYVKDARAEIAARPEALEVLAASIGAYLGEVVRRAYGATWFVGGDYDGWRLDMTRVYLTFNPIGMAYEALTLSPAEGWHAHLEVDDAYKEEIARRLEALPEVSEEEYALPSTRFDVIALTIEAVRARMVEDGTGDVTFGPEDYKRT